MGCPNVMSRVTTKSCSNVTEAGKSEKLGVGSMARSCKTFSSKSLKGKDINGLTNFGRGSAMILRW